VGEGLTGISANEPVSFSVKRFEWEGFKVRPNRCGSQYTLFHLLDQIFDDKGLDFHMNDCSTSGKHSVNAFFESKHSAAKADERG
jgi:hypothetical protein